MKYLISVCLFFSIVSVAKASIDFVQCIDKNEAKIAYLSTTYSDSINTEQMDQEGLDHSLSSNFRQQQGGGEYTEAVKRNYDFSQNRPSQQALSEKVIVTQASFNQSQHDFSLASSDL